MRPEGAKTWIEISRSALRSNAVSFMKHVRPSKVLAIVKANAYGHGAIECAQEFSVAGIPWLGVDSIDEAIELRSAKIKKPILILGYIPLDRLPDAVRSDLSFVAYNPETIRAISRVKTNKKIRIHLPLETGLHRQGIRLEDLSMIMKLIKADSRIIVEGVSMHFANIEDTKSRSYADHQLGEFKKGIEVLKKLGLNPLKHTAATAGSILYSDTHFDIVRVGIGMYGLWPSENTRSRSKIRLQPALTWKTIIAQIKPVKKGSPVSYGLTERVKRDSKIAVLPIGYAEGFDRVGMSKRAHVLIRGLRCKVIGRVCMNMCMVDVTDVPDAKLEDEVVLIGKSGKQEITVEDMAKLAGTINYETVARLNPQIPRILVK